MTHARPFGISLPADPPKDMRASINTAKGCVEHTFAQAVVGYFPGPGYPEFVVVWHLTGTEIIEYHNIEHLGPVRA